MNDAQNTILSEIQGTGLEEIALPAAVGRVLGKDITANRDHPSRDNSAMDGYAIRAQDIAAATRSMPAVLNFAGEVPAGQVPERSLKAVEAISVMTGAPIPEGADAVVEMERAQRAGDKVKVFGSVSVGCHIRRRGENLKEGGTVLVRGSLLGSPEIGLLALLGKSQVLVFRRPEVAILATGDELADLDEYPEPGGTYNANGYALWAQVLEAGGVPRLLGVAKDSKAALGERVRAGLSSDILLISGSVSVGRYDYVRSVLPDLGVRVQFESVAVRPGHPLVFGTFGPRLVFGLPGNPVATMVAFEVFVRPALRKMSGHRSIFAPIVQAVATQAMTNRPGRTHFVRVVVQYDGDGYQVRPAGPQGSGILMSMVHANGLAILPPDCEKVEPGMKVSVLLLGSRWVDSIPPNQGERLIKNGL